MRAPERNPWEAVPDKYQLSHLEVIQTLLYPKIQGEAVAREGEVIVEHNLYATSPKSLNWNPISGLRDNERYFFVRRKPLSRLVPKAKNAERTVETGEGYWKKYRKYKIKEGATVKGYYDLLNYWEYKGNGEDKTYQNSVRIDHFLMHEFYLPGSTVEDWVVCLVKYKVHRNAVQQQQVTMIPLPPEVTGQPPAMVLLAPPEADQQPAIRLLLPKETYGLMFENDGTCNVSHSLCESFSLQPHPKDELQWMDQTPLPEEALIMEESTATIMEVDHGQQEEEAINEEDDGCFLRALERLLEDDDDDSEYGLFVSALERQLEQDDDDDDNSDNGLFVTAPERQLEDDDSDEYNKSIAMEMDTEEHQHEEDEEASTVLSGYERFCRVLPPMPPLHVFENPPVWLRNSWFLLS